MSKLIIISNSELRQLKVKDNNEQLVDLRDYCFSLEFKIAHYIKKNGGSVAVEDAHYARKGIADRLNIAQSALPKGFQLLIECAYRSPILQQKSYDAIYKTLNKEHPSWGEEQLEKEMEKRVSPVDIAPHCTGGAIDLTIIDENNIQLDMGTNLDEFSEKTYTHSQSISEVAKKNRSILIKVMLFAGFVNFPAEWWHWSYGDREWASLQKNKTAIYDLIGR
jgi:D-alanyl-D-alanine dipeptidase